MDTIEPCRIAVVDVETTSEDPQTGGIVEIGIEWLFTGRKWSMKCRPRPGAIIDPKAIEVNGCDWLDDPTVAPESEALELMREEVGDGPVLMAGLHPFFDWRFLKIGYDRLGPEMAAAFPFSRRLTDLHGLAVTYALANGEPVPSKGFYTDEIYALLGMPPEPRPHRAQVGASMEAEALRMLMGVVLGAEPVPYDLKFPSERVITHERPMLDACMSVDGAEMVIRFGEQWLVIPVSDDNRKLCSKLYDAAMRELEDVMGEEIERERNGICSGVDN